ncbi:MULTISPECIES: TetR/AcrR family transcriptional regulator [Gordonia]|uniref:TetR/AcrR family transcriptional regulator n=2 Tax=Gordonia TaxID=2053 RepID=A0ABN3I018_9ACTN|nr:MULTISPECIES: TetR/AcrR family transcriptional regulator [Gordonia]AUH67417.1 TetR/AcrR family transcriptional regulator [Gordonia sp. YC-JH1]KJR07794.1 transcriptional regulator [Gordonia sihwensis]KXT56131.1 transcriptional regulator [Gordonia sp. QH-12]MBY4570483.1 transcriptional regulator [Gordonia sihwensis]WFN92940.1 TetR/AcrR family transcriptional regulator [Gordonia sihwensis]
MPKISADSLAEHREAVLSALIDGTERILLSRERLTAASVAAEAGIARNSIYRYVSSIDDLVDMVVARGFEEWASQVRADVAAAADPRAAVVAYVRSNLTLAAGGEHALQRSLAHAGLSESARERISDLHGQIAAVLHEAVARSGAAHPDLVIAAVGALVDSSLALVGPEQDSESVIDFMCGAAEAIVDSD